MLKKQTNTIVSKKRTGLRLSLGRGISPAFEPGGGVLLPKPECEGTVLALDAAEPDQGCGAGAKLWAELDRLIGV